MKVVEFNVDNGVYCFEINDFETVFHTHPTIEIIIAIKGKFSLNTADARYRELELAIIDSNLKHQLIAQDCEVRLLMLEHKNEWIKTFLKRIDISTHNGVFVESSKNRLALLGRIFEAGVSGAFENNAYDDRVWKLLEFIDSKQVRYQNIIEDLRSEVNLSESRLSHLFKQNVGLSLKRYIVWSRLKKTIQLVVQEGLSLYAASIRSGFHDQAHFSKAFKSILGISPSEVYNSRILQE